MNGRAERCIKTLWHRSHSQLVYAQQDTFMWALSIKLVEWVDGCLVNSVTGETPNFVV